MIMICIRHHLEVKKMKTHYGDEEYRDGEAGTAAR